MVEPAGQPSVRLVMISKVLLLVVALAAAFVAAQKPADILFLVSAAFSHRGFRLLPGAGAGCVLAAGQPPGRGGGHAGRAER